MSTRSMICAKQPDGTYKAIYCHFNGYPSHNGRILLGHYQDNEKIAALMDLGDISILGPNIGSKHDFDAPYDTIKDQCNAYMRDRGESDCEADVVENLAALPDMDQEYVYVWDGKQWLVDGFIHMEEDDDGDEVYDMPLKEVNLDIN